jgi:predicted secreted protein
MNGDSRAAPNIASLGSIPPVDGALRHRRLFELTESSKQRKRGALATTVKRGTSQVGAVRSAGRCYAAYELQVSTSGNHRLL